MVERNIQVPLETRHTAKGLIIVNNTLPDNLKSLLFQPHIWANSAGDRVSDIGGKRLLRNEARARGKTNPIFLAARASKALSDFHGALVEDVIATMLGTDGTIRTLSYYPQDVIDLNPTDRLYREQAARIQDDLQMLALEGITVFEPEFISTERGPMHIGVAAWFSIQ